MKTIGDAYELIEYAKKTAHNLGLIRNDFPKNSFHYETLSNARKLISDYVEVLMKTKIDEQ